jgi:hypothetical protein
MASIGGPNVVNSGLIFGYDTGQPSFSNNINTRLYRGRPTTNLLSGVGMSTYNNVGGNVSSVLEGLSETFQGAQVIKQTLTAADASGVSYLSNGNNPGIGVVTSGGGGLANRYTGHSIFFKPTVPMHSSPIFTNYSNIGGWQSSNLYEAVGDGWFRAYVTWYNTSTASDGKYWAINPQQAVVNQPIVIYWAGPFKEDLNSQAVSPYIYSSRSSTDAVIDAKRISSIDTSNASFSSTNNVMFFDGTNDSIDISTNLGTLSQYTIEHVSFKGSNDRMPISHRTNTSFYQYGDNSWAYTHGGVFGEYYYPKSVTINGWGHWTIVYNGTHVRIYRNGVYEGQQSTTGTADWTAGIKIGYWAAGGGYAWDGQIAVARMYNRALSDSEVSQNFQAYKPRFGL